jgi:hypothetical protein
MRGTRILVAISEILKEITNLAKRHESTRVVA